MYFNPLQGFYPTKCPTRLISLLGDMITSSLAVDTKTPSGMLQGAFWYWVGESNSYCEIENLEY